MFWLLKSACRTTLPTMPRGDVCCAFSVFVTQVTCLQPPAVRAVVTGTFSHLDVHPDVAPAQQTGLQTNLLLATRKIQNYNQRLRYNGHVDIRVRFRKASDEEDVDDFI